MRSLGHFHSVSCAFWPNETANRFDLLEFINTICIRRFCLTMTFSLNKLTFILSYLSHFFETFFLLANRFSDRMWSKTRSGLRANQRMAMFRNFCCLFWFQSFIFCRSLPLSQFSFHSYSANGDWIIICHFRNRRNDKNRITESKIQQQTQRRISRLEFFVWVRIISFAAVVVTPSWNYKFWKNVILRRV